MSSADSKVSVPDKAHADIGLVAALSLELAAFRTRFLGLRTYKGGEFTFRGGICDDMRVVMVETGAGGARAQRATRGLIEGHTPDWVVSVGFSGSLLPEMKIGDIVVANGVCDEAGAELAIDMKMPANPGRGLYVDKIVTVGNIVRLISEKQALREKTGAVAVDMETLAVARVCQEMGKRFVAVRVISDDMSADLPPEVISVLGGTSFKRMGAIAGALWKRPSSYKDLWKLREQADLAAEKLAVFLDGLLPQLYESIR